MKRNRPSSQGWRAHNGVEPMELTPRPERSATARMAINTDVTENRLAFEWLRLAETEAARRASELQGVLDAMPAATFIAHDPDMSKYH